MLTNKSKRLQRGFTLLAMSGVLIAASLATATLLVSQDNKQTWEPKLESSFQLKEVEKFLVSFQRQNHRLPCPAPVNHAPDSVGYGIEGANCALGGAISGITRINSGGAIIRIGVLPVRTLGVPSKIANDAWGSRITYAVVEQLTDPYQFSEGPFTGMRVNNAAGTALTTNAAFIMLSHGAKAEGGYSAKSGLQIGSCGAAQGLDQQNCNNDHIFVQAETNPVEGASFSDDNLIFRTVDAQAKAINKPCYAPSTPTPSWGASCSGPFVNTLHLGTQTIGNTTAEYSGSANVTCNNGVFTIDSSTCTHTPSCPATTENWVGSVAGCTAARGSLAHGGSATLTNTTGGRTGTVNVSCSYGVITQSGGSCVGDSCSIPWGGSITHGGSISAFSVSSVPCGSSCPSEVRTCSFGVLSGSYSVQSCTAAACSNCTAPWGATVPHNSSTTAFAAASVGCGSSCASETRSCWNGALSGSYGSASCSAAPCASCGLPWGGAIGHGGSVYAYNTWDAGCGGTCYGETRSCYDGTLSGSYGAASCGASCASCALPWGGSIGHGGAVVAYANGPCPSGGGSSSSDGGGDGGGGPGDGGGAGDGGAFLFEPNPYIMQTRYIPAKRHNNDSADYSDLLIFTQGDGGDSGGGAPPTTPCVSEIRSCWNGGLSGSYGSPGCPAPLPCGGGSSSSDGGGDGGMGPN